MKMVAINLLIMALSVWGYESEKVLARPRSMPKDLPIILDQLEHNIEYDDSIVCNCKRSEDGTLVLSCTTEDIYKLNVLKQRDIQTLISNARKDKRVRAIDVIGFKREPYVAAFKRSGFEVVAQSNDGGYVALRKHLE